MASLGARGWLLQGNPNPQTLNPETLHSSIPRVIPAVGSLHEHLHTAIVTFSAIEAGCFRLRAPTPTHHNTVACIYVAVSLWIVI